MKTLQGNSYENELINDINKPVTVLGYSPKGLLMVLVVWFVLFIMSWYMLIIGVGVALVAGSAQHRAQKEGDNNFLGDLVRMENRSGEIVDDGISSVINCKNEKE